MRDQTICLNVECPLKMDCWRKLKRPGVSVYKDGKFIGQKFKKFMPYRYNDEWRCREFVSWQSETLKDAKLLRSYVESSSKLHAKRR